MNRPFHGVVPAMVTPFRENERIDYGAWQVLIDFLIASGVHGLYAVGPHGEFYTLDMEERTVAMRFCKQAIAKRVPLYVNVGCITTRDTVALALQAQALDVDAVVIVTPYFVRLTQHELLEHYVEVCRAIRLPVIASNVPLHGGAELDASTVAEIADQCPNFAGIEDSSGRRELALAYRAAVENREFRVFTGIDHVCVPALEAGASGTFTASANVVPRLFVDLYQAFRARDLAGVGRLQSLADGLSTVLSSPAVIKEALGMLGVPVGRCRKPVGAASAEARRQLIAAIEQLRVAGVLPAVTHRARA
jgi:4-hydroxy-tetrahydrodipicolinate synthase